MTQGLTRIGSDDVGSFLRDHVDRADDEEAGDAGEHGCVYDSEPGRVMDLEVTCQYAARLLRADRARARRVMTPRMVPNELAQLIVGVDRVARQFFLGDQIGMQRAVFKAGIASFRNRELASATDNRFLPPSHHISRPNNAPAMNCTSASAGTALFSL